MYIIYMYIIYIIYVLYIYIIYILYIYYIYYIYIYTKGGTNKETTELNSPPSKSTSANPFTLCTWAKQSVDIN